ncbi:MAG: hypothetical protein H7Z37_00855 [Pyrinomonadaceae bacterium]|nr:hypothetical protein [Pyrinomonadaceae bacterium]
MNTTDSGLGSAGGIYTEQQTVVITNSTISGNSAAGETFLTGGMLNVGPLNNTTVTNCTITNNSALTNGSSGGLSWGNGTTLVRNSIIAANANNSSIPDVGGTFTSSGFNLVGNRGSSIGFTQPTDQFGTGGIALNPMLTSLSNFGGTIPTHSFVNRSSPAIDKGNSSGQTTDARGLPRIFENPTVTNATGGDGADIGAVELQGTTAAGISIGGRVLTANGKGLTNAIVTLTTANGETRTARTSFKGRFGFADIGSGETVILSVKSKHYQFESQALSANEDVNNINFTAQ